MCIIIAYKDFLAQYRDTSKCERFCTLGTVLSNMTKIFDIKFTSNLRIIFLSLYLQKCDKYYRNTYKSVIYYAKIFAKCDFRCIISIE